MTTLSRTTGMIIQTPGSRFPLRGKLLPCLLLLTVIFSESYSQPMPGDIYRDYVWTTPDSSEYEFLRVTGDGDYREPVHHAEVYPAECIEDGWILFNHEIDLEKATRAEVQLEFVLSHDDTRGFALKLNQFDWHFLKMPDAVPEPKAAYLQHNFPVIKIPLEEIREGRGNRIRFRVDSLQRFGMPQNIIYGFRLRIYYNESKKHASASIGGLKDGDYISENQVLELETCMGRILKVDYVALCRDVNWEGDGIYRQWHYSYYRGDICNHIGSAVNFPFRVNWNTSWLPDQEEVTEVSALVTNEEGITYFLPPVKGSGLARDYSVELYTPTDIPENWVTREKEYREQVFVPGDTRDVSSFQLVFTSWSPGYLNGIMINDWLVPGFEDCRYCYGRHRIELDKAWFLKQGLNEIKTLLTPLVYGQMVHGTEIMFPGIMLLVKYRKKAVEISDTIWKGSGHYMVRTPLATWYIEKESGGCSALIDRDGRDWVNFSKTGDNPPLMSSDSDFRGIPNLVFGGKDNGVGHPGFESCFTTRVSHNELLVRSKSGKWQYRWVFYTGYAEIEIEKADPSRSYWFLYEGPVKGSFSPGEQYWGNDKDGFRDDRPSIYSNPVSGHWRWAFFGQENKEMALFILQKKEDNIRDYFSYMGNDPEKGNSSSDGMNVFGFGRDLNTNPLLKDQNTFVIGFFPGYPVTEEGYLALRNYVESFYTTTIN